jgi:hypothetical protein
MVRPCYINLFPQNFSAESKSPSQGMSKPSARPRITASIYKQDGKIAVNQEEPLE